MVELAKRVIHRHSRMTELTEHMVWVNELAKRMVLLHSWITAGQRTIHWQIWMTEVTKHTVTGTAAWTNCPNTWFVFGLLSNRGYLDGIVLLCYRQTIVVCCVSLEYVLCASQISHWFNSNYCTYIIYGQSGRSSQSWGWLTRNTLRNMYFVIVV
jgi:hypothetical protein